MPTHVIWTFEHMIFCTALIFLPVGLAIITGLLLGGLSSRGLGQGQKANGGRLNFFAGHTAVIFGAGGYTVDHFLL